MCGDRFYSESGNSLLSMSGFNFRQSEELDEEIVSTLSSLLADQKTLKEKEEREEFLLKERKMAYDLLARINGERIVPFILTS